MRKRRRLRPWVKIVLRILLLAVLLILFYLYISCAVKSYDNFYEQCDDHMGRACTYYEARQYMIRGE